MTGETGFDVAVIGAGVVGCAIARRFAIDGARVLIAPLAQMFLLGTEIDYEETMLESGFKFRNPNVVESCGCGESVKFRDAPAG